MTTKTPVRLALPNHNPTTGKLGILIHFKGMQLLKVEGQPTRRISPSEVEKLTFQPTNLFIKKK